MNKIKCKKKKIVAFVITLFCASYILAGDIEVRDIYNEQILNMYEPVKLRLAPFHKSGQPVPEKVARSIYEQRQRVKEKEQNNTSYFGYYLGIPIHNLYNYGSYYSPTYEYFLNKGKTHEEIAYSACKTDGGDLGLKNNGVGHTLDIWKKLKGNGEKHVFPHHIDVVKEGLIRENELKPTDKRKKNYIPSQKEVIDYLYGQSNTNSEPEVDTLDQSVNYPVIVLALPNQLKKTQNKKTGTEEDMTPEKQKPQSSTEDIEQEAKSENHSVETPAILPEKDKNQNKVSQLDREAENQTATVPAEPNKVNAGKPPLPVEDTIALNQQKQITQDRQAINKSINEIEQKLAVVNNQINQTHKQIQKNAQKTAQGIAATAALGSLTLPSAPGHAVISAGTGSYDGKQAFSISAGYRPEKYSNMSFQGGVAASQQGKPVIRLGASYEF